MGFRMGLWAQVKSLWAPRATIEATIETQIKCFQWEQMRNPDRDPNAWLAASLSKRLGYMHKAEAVYYLRTALYSVAPGLQAPTALGMWLLSREEPDLGATCEQALSRIMYPIMKLAVTCQLGTRWQEVNPWTAKQYPWIAEGVKSGTTPEGMARYEQAMGQEVDW